MQTLSDAALARLLFDGARWRNGHPVMSAELLALRLVSRRLAHVWARAHAWPMRRVRFSLQTQDAYVHDWERWRCVCSLLETRFAPAARLLRARGNFAATAVATAAAAAVLGVSAGSVSNELQQQQQQQQQQQLPSWSLLPRLLFSVPVHLVSTRLEGVQRARPAPALAPPGDALGQTLRAVLAACGGLELCVLDTFGVPAVWAALLAPVLQLLRPLTPRLEVDLSACQDLATLGGSAAVPACLSEADALRLGGARAFSNLAEGALLPLAQGRVREIDTGAKDGDGAPPALAALVAHCAQRAAAGDAGVPGVNVNNVALAEASAADNVARFAAALSAASAAQDIWTARYRHHAGGVTLNLGAALLRHMLSRGHDACALHLLNVLGARCASAGAYDTVREDAVAGALAHVRFVSGMWPKAYELRWRLLEALLEHGAPLDGNGAHFFSELSIDVNVYGASDTVDADATIDDDLGVPASVALADLRGGSSQRLRVPLRLLVEACTRIAACGGGGTGRSSVAAENAAGVLARLRAWAGRRHKTPAEVRAGTACLPLELALVGQHLKTAVYMATHLGAALESAFVVPAQWRTGDVSAAVPALLFALQCQPGPELETAMLRAFAAQGGRLCRRRYTRVTRTAMLYGGAPGSQGGYGGQRELCVSLLHLVLLDDLSVDTMLTVLAAACAELGYTGRPRDWDGGGGGGGGGLAVVAALAAHCAQLDGAPTPLHLLVWGAWELEKGDKQTYCARALELLALDVALVAATDAFGRTAHALALNLFGDDEVLVDCVRPRGAYRHLVIGGAPTARPPPLPLPLPAFAVVPDDYEIVVAELE